MAQPNCLTLLEALCDAGYEVSLETGGAISLESLFLDEGFGTLDADALDVAIEALELLASGDRMIGIISHVPLIAERLPDRIEVAKAAGRSVVRA